MAHSGIYRLTRAGVKRCKRLYQKTSFVVRKRVFASRYRNRLLIVDDIFPALISAFRIAEYNAYLGRYCSGKVYSTGASFPLVRENRTFAEVLRDYESAYPALKGRVCLFGPDTLPIARLIYTIFIHNAFNFLPFAESCGAPIVFTLYPGGGFQLDDSASDEKLRRVFESKCFRGVIVTQSVTRDYLLSRRFCPPEQVHFAYGAVIPEAMFAPPICPKRRFGVDKDTIDICFVAHKYMPGGVDKGYDVFLDVARRLASHRPEARFHVVGPWDETDGDMTAIQERVRFHGSIQTNALRSFYRKMDLILSPNASFTLQPGAFDGFPTACCIDAALCGVAVFCTDPLNLNTAFRDREDIVLITRNADEVFEIVDAYCRDCGKLYQLAAKGVETFRSAFSPEAQLPPRFALLDQFLC